MDNKEKVERLLLKRLFEHLVSRYLDARDEHFLTAASPSHAATRMWARLPARALLAGGGGGPWHLPSHEIFLDGCRLLCDHMTLYGLGQLLSSGVTRARKAHEPSVVERFWQFTDAALTYSVLCSLLQVLRWMMVDLVYGTERDSAGKVLPKRLAVDPEDLERWASEPQDSSSVLWCTFEQAASALTDLFDANMTGDYKLHCTAIHTLTRVFIHATEHPVASFGFVDILILYDLFLQESPASDVGGSLAAEVKLAHMQTFEQRFWGVRQPAHGQLYEADMYQEHLAGRSRIGLRQLEPPEDSWLLASNERFKDLQKGRLGILMRKMYSIGRTPLQLLVQCKREHFAQALSSDDDLVVAATVEAITNLMLLRLEAGSSAKTYLPDVGFEILIPLLELMAEAGSNDSNDSSRRCLALHLAGKGAPAATVAPTLLLRLIVAIWVQRAGGDVLANANAKPQSLASNVPVLLFLICCLSSQYADIVEAACLSLVKFFETPLQPAVLSALLPLLVDEVLAMLRWNDRGLRTSHAAMTLLHRLLHDYEHLDIPKLPELTALVAKAMAPIFLGDLFDKNPLDIYGDAFGDNWCPRGKRAELDELNPLYERLTDDVYTATAEVVVLLLQRDPTLLGTCFVKQSGLHAMIGTIGKLRATEAVAAVVCLRLLGRLVAISNEIALGLVSMNNAVMLLTVCANLGDSEIQNAAEHVINQTLQKLPSADMTKDGTGVAKSEQLEVARSVLKMALERETAKCVIENMSMLMMTHDNRSMTALEYSFQDTCFFKKSFEKAREVMSSNELDASGVFHPSYLVDGFDMQMDLIDGPSETQVVLCQNCGAPEIDSPHQFCDISGIYCSADCQRQRFDAHRVANRPGPPVAALDVLHMVDKCDSNSESE